MKVLQFNTDRGRAATTLAEKEFVENYDLALIQEPYRLFAQSEDYARVRLGTANKAEIWVKRGLPVTVVQGLTTENFVTIRIDGEHRTYVTTIYEEPGGVRNRRLEELEQKITDRIDRHLLAGDMNAHCRTWGHEETDRRGEELLAWSITNQYDIANDKDQGPTFQTSRGQSYIDITMAKGITIEEWKVHSAETLSGHKYITYRIREVKETEGKIRIYDFRNTDWEQFKRTLREKFSRGEYNMMRTEQKAEYLQKICRQTCQAKITRREVDVIEVDSWWDARLARAKAQVQRKRRIWQASRTEEDKRNFIRERNNYKREICKAKERHLMERLTNQIDQNPWHRAWSMVIRKKAYIPPKDTQKDDGTYTSNEEEANDYLLRKYFPDDNPENDTRNMRRMRDDRTSFAEFVEPTVCEEEVAEVISNLKKRKAVCDRIPNEAMPAIFEELREDLVEIYRECWDEGIFPRVWKSATIVWIPKKNGAPRPISLLPTLGKIMDKLVNRRLQNHLELTGNIDKRQFAYRQGVGTINALKEYTERLREAKDEGKHSATIALDLTNAFNSAWTPYLAAQLKKCGVGKRLGRICLDFLKNRKVASGTVERSMEKGCPQGSSLGPTLWNVVMQGWFDTLTRYNEEWKTREMEVRGVPEQYVEELMIAQAYADDQLVIVRGNSARRIEEKWELVWRACKEWEAESNTSYNIGKTELLFAEKDNKAIRPPVISLDGTQVEAKSKLKYLGVVIDKKMNFTEHIKEVRRKSQALTNKIVQAARKTYGNRSNFIRTVVERVAKPAVLYAAEIWGERAAKTTNRKCLTAAQRPFILACVRAYRTTANAALQVLNGTPPWWLEAKVLYDENVRNLQHIRNEKLTASRMISLPRRVELKNMQSCANRNERKTYVDACGTETTTGIGNVTTKDGRTMTGIGYITRKVDTDRAEELAIWMALRRSDEEENDVTIITDRLGIVGKIKEARVTNNIELEIWRTIEKRRQNGYATRILWASRNNPGIVLADQAAERGGRRQGVDLEPTLQDFLYKKKAARNKERKTELLLAWQALWDEENKGRELYRNCSQVGFDRIPISFQAVQFATGHGNLREYLRRFALRPTDGVCECGLGAEDMEHVRETCRRQGRMEIRNNIERQYGNRLITLRRANVVDMEEVRKIEAWAQVAMDREEYGQEEVSSGEEEP